MVRAAGLALGVLVALASPARALVGHYTAGVPNAHDFFLPPDPGIYYVQYNYFYTANSFRNRNGDSIDSVTLPTGGTVAVDTGIDLWAISPTFIWAPDWSWHGIRYASYVLLTVASPSLSAAVGDVESGLSVSTGDVGFGDMFVQPLWLQWSWDRLDVAGGYGFYAPVGRFESGATDNVGYGFWTQQFQLSGALYFDEARTFSLIGAQTWEFNSDVRDENLRPGSRLSFNWALDKIWLDGMLETAIVGYDQWQVSEDTGSDQLALTAGVLDSVHAAGFQVGVPKYGIALKYFHEFQAQQRFQGNVVTFTFALPLDVIFKRLAG